MGIPTPAHDPSAAGDGGTSPCFRMGRNMGRLC